MSLIQCPEWLFIIIQIDVNKMPLGKLSKKQIENAYKVLTEALTEIQGDKNPTKLLDASNRFYTLIPHDFGLQSPPLLDDEEFIKVCAWVCVCMRGCGCTYMYIFVCPSVYASVYQINYL